MSGRPPDLEERPLRSLPPSLPSVGGPLRRAIGRGVLRAARWRVAGDIMDLPKQVMIVAPHTSNWDFVIGLAVKWALRIDASWLGKHTLFRGPWGWFFRAVGGIPVHRATSSDVVAQSVTAFARADWMLLVLAPEGTRAEVLRWRTGFWHIARGAGVPVLLVAFDYANRVVRFGPTVWTGEEMEADLARIQAHYAGVRGRR